MSAVDALTALTRGEIVSEHVPSKTGQGRVFVWTFRHGRLVRLQEFDSYHEAEVASRPPGV